MIFSSIFLHAVTFSHVLHLDVFRIQIELKLKVKIENSLCMAIMQNHPLPSSTTVLCDSTWCIMICLVITTLSLLLFTSKLKIQSGAIGMV